MGIITKMLKQTAVYWEKTGVDDYGQPTWAAPIEIRCRWEDRTEEFVSPEGTREASMAVVYVGQDVVVGGVLMLGLLGSSVDENDPKANLGAWEIRSFSKLPDLKAKQFLRTVML
jgi:hypothetical protein